MASKSPVIREGWLTKQGMHVVMCRMVKGGVCGGAGRLLSVVGGWWTWGRWLSLARSLGRAQLMKQLWVVVVGMAGGAWGVGT